MAKQHLVDGLTIELKILEGDVQMQLTPPGWDSEHFGHSFDGFFEATSLLTQQQFWLNLNSL
jgi:hypothetical protein